jgi:hypothetical protein
MFKDIIVECRALCEGRTKEQQRAGLDAMWAKRPHAATKAVGNDPDTSAKRKWTRGHDPMNNKVFVKKRIDKDQDDTIATQGYKYPAEYGNLHKLKYAQKRNDARDLPAAQVKKPGFMARLASKFKK